MTVRILTGDCRDVLRTLPAESVHCVVTSPPYFGLRDYGVAGQIGLEPTPDEFVDQLVEVFRDVRRVLRCDGVCWINLGDSYANDGKWGGHTGGKHVKALHCSPIGRNKRYTGLKAKDLIGIPWMVAFALRADGWYLRQDIIWSKPNPMPESVQDRCTRAHEHLFMLTKSARYYYDADAIAEPASATSHGAATANAGPKAAARGDAGSLGLTVRQRDKQRGHGRRHAGFNDRWDAMERTEQCSGLRNKRSVWTVGTSPFPEAHFATFPPALIEPCILAGCPEKVCAKCGAPWVREIEIGEPHKETTRGRQAWAAETGQRDSAGGLPMRSRVTRGFISSCGCNVLDSDRGLVLDPFGGAGTTGVVADRLGRDAILIELNPEYAAMAKRRITADAGMFASVVSQAAE